MKKIIACNQLYSWRIIKTKQYYKLQHYNGLWWRTVTKSTTDAIRTIYDYWVHTLDLIFVV